MTIHQSKNGYQAEERIGRIVIMSPLFKTEQEAIQGILAYIKKR